MRPRSRKSQSQRGFTFVELLVTITSLVIILVVSTQLMFAMRRGVVRQQLQVEARQSARAAADYTSMLLRGATDFNRVGGNSGAILTWLTRNKTDAVVCPGDNACYQVTYNNVTSDDNSNGILADEGTDIITFARPTSTRIIVPLRWPGWQHAANVRWDARPFCADVANNAELAFQNFKIATGEHGGKSDPLLLVDDLGRMAFYQITDYKDFSGNDCVEDTVACRDNANPLPAGQEICFHVVSNKGQSDGINPPGGQPELENPKLYIGVRFASLRVRNGWLEQKDGIFDPTTDNPGTAFVPILPNIEDLQIAWIFADGTIRNDSTAAGRRITASGNVPQMGTAGPAPDDVRSVVGVRVTYTSRSGQGMPVEPNRFVRPAAEDHAAGTVVDTTYRYQVSANAMIRNRLAGS